jgi:CoA:oxalate CoA-transferase
LTPYETFETSNGYVTVGVGNDVLWQRFCKAVDRPDLDQPEFKTNAQRVENHKDLKALLNDLFITEPTSHWLEKLEAAGIPVGSVRSIPEVFGNPQIEARRMLVELEHPALGQLKVTGNPIKLDGVDDRAPLPPPLLGQHTEEVLRDKLKLDEAQIEMLHKSGAI